MKKTIEQQLESLKNDQNHVRQDMRDEMQSLHSKFDAISVKLDKIINAE